MFKKVFFSMDIKLIKDKVKIINNLRNNTRKNISVIIYHNFSNYVKRNRKCMHLFTLPVAIFRVSMLFYNFSVTSTLVHNSL